jgi:hypothetical protein
MPEVSYASQSGNSAGDSVNPKMLKYHVLLLFNIQWKPLHIAWISASSQLLAYDLDDFENINVLEHQTLLVSSCADKSLLIMPARCY